MPRPRTTGPTIGIRLSVADHEELARRAEKAGGTPAAYVKYVVESHLRRSERGASGPRSVPAESPAERAAGTPPVNAGVDSTTCAHASARVLASGPRVCECGAVSNDRGATWRRA